MKKMKSAIVLLPAVVLFLVLALDCSPYLSENGGSCPCKDGWKCCSDKCIPEQYICTPVEEQRDDGDGGVKPDGGDSTESGSDQGDLEIPVKCSCRHPEDVLIDSNNRPNCMRQYSTCNALNLCEEGYDCAGECFCADLDVCGIDCSSGCYCPAPLECDHKTNLCRAPLGCLGDSMCSNGQVCREVEPAPNYNIDYNICVFPAGADTGQSCQDFWNCRSGVCYTQICLQFCTRNSDCPQDQHCGLVDHGMMGCVAQTNCNPECALPDEYCYQLSETECRNDFCRTSADCPGDCELSDLDRRPRVGRCVESSVCEDNEIVHGIHDNARCIIYQSCWTDLDCESPYQCLELLSFGVENFGFCGRWVQ